MELSAVVLWVGWTWIVYRVGKRNGKREVIQSTADEPASDRQLAYILSLSRELSVDPPPTEGLTKAQASLSIEALLQQRG